MKKIINIAPLIVSTLILAGCYSFEPVPIEKTEAWKRVQTKSDKDMEVSVVVLGEDDCEKVFECDLYEKNIQPVWVKIKNKTQKPYWFAQARLDRDYYSAYEVAWINHSNFSGSYNQKLDDYFYDNEMRNYVAPGGERSGYVYANLDYGSKAIFIDLFSIDDTESFVFIVQVPGLKSNYKNIDFTTLYPKEKLWNCDEQELRSYLTKIPDCATNKSGTIKGDPLNLVVIGNLEEVLHAFVPAGWDEVETITGGSILRTMDSFLFGTRYRYSPMSPLYLFGRPQDLALQKARQTINERNHLRLWMSKLRYQGKPVWIGQISRDIGVRFTSRTWNMTTHKIDPDVDETRDYLIQDLAYAQGIKSFGYVSGVGKVNRDKPRENLTGDPYFTDGYRLVISCSDSIVPLKDIQDLKWEIPPER